MITLVMFKTATRACRVSRWVLLLYHSSSVMREVLALVLLPMHSATLPSTIYIVLEVPVLLLPDPTKLKDP